MRKIRFHVSILSILFVFGAVCATAQTTPFLNDNEIRMLQNEISGDRAFEHIRVLSQWHRASGSEGYFKSVEYVVRAAKEAGLEDVRFVEQPMQGPAYTAKSGELWMVEPVEVKLADIGDHATSLADGSHDADVSAELVYIGTGSQADVKDLDVKGKIVLTSGSPGQAAMNAVYAKGAIGIVSYQTSEGKSVMDYPDQIGWNGIPVNPPDGKKGTFAFILSPRKGDALRRILETNQEQDILATGKRTKGGRIVVRAKVDTEVGSSPGKTGFVEGWIRGTTHKDQQIVLTAHLQEEQGSANDDGSGCGNLLEVARSFNKLIKEGKMKRPLRDIRFWWVDEIYSEYRYFQDNPAEPANILVNLHQDMTGANQSLASRVQHLIFAPHSRTSYLDALFESIGTYVILTNNAFLAASRQGGLPRPFTRPIFSTRGSRQNYSARFVPYFDSSDHLVFVDGIFGIPAVAMINWDDDFIHSSDDDIHRLDQTQLQRNNFIIAGMAYRLALTEPKDVPLFVSETYAQGLKRLANDFDVAGDLFQSADVTGSTNAWKDATILIEQGVERELRALASVRILAGTDPGAVKAIENALAQARKKKEFLLADLAVLYQNTYGNDPQPVQLTAEEEAAAKKVSSGMLSSIQEELRSLQAARRTARDARTREALEERMKKMSQEASLTDFLTRRQSIPFQAGGALHGLMRSEVFNFVDGKRSYYDIYKAVKAEALAGGSWYYGTVTLQDVVNLLDAGLVSKAYVFQ